MSSLANSIRELRKRLKLNQTEFAERIGVQQSAVSKWETGNATPEHAPMLKLHELGLFQEEYSGVTPQNFGPDLHNFRSGRDIKIKVMGAINNFRVVDQWRWASKNDIDLVVPYIDEWEGLHLVGLYVQPSHAQDIPYAPGSILFVALYGYGGLEPVDDDLIVFEKKLDDGRRIVGVRYIEVASDTGDLTVVTYQPKVWDRPYEEERIFRSEIMERGFAHYGLVGLVVGALANDSWRLQRRATPRR